MNKQQFDEQYAVLSDELTATLARYPGALKNMKLAPRGEQLQNAIDHYERIIEQEKRIRMNIGAIHKQYMLYLDNLIDGAYDRARA